MDVLCLVGSGLLGFVSGLLGFWLMWSIANRCQTRTAVAMLCAIMILSGISYLLAFLYAAEHGGAYFTVPFAASLVGLSWLVIIFWIRFRFFAAIQMFFYNLTKKKTS